ncbi:T9SS type A sorting domain-containing protein [uncultured Draconibacterium sp.]|uniref:T9SS type A sorting domain-containing protein n=1 Tax=uncultured Draconibacterium sp. TaxID=1573823 RepID=UPI0029C70BEA|nr:T9SS type A sorting domain-containing protein [uncultured Draconibacterium sp.]
MKKYIYILLWLLSPFCMQAQTTIVQAEYWFDGQYSTVQNSPTGGAILNHTDLIDASALIDGLHTISYRFKDNRGIWGVPLVKFFTKDSNTPGIHFITEYQYWFDVDYSNMQTGTATGASFNLNTDIDVTGLINGLHTVTYRFKDSRGVWGAPLVKFFTKDKAAGIHEIVKYEYWFNDDYAAKTVQTVTSATNLNIGENLDVSALSIGIHTLSYRFQDDAGKWCAPRTWMFHNVPSQDGPEIHEVIAMEYWFNGNHSVVESSPISSNGTFQLETTLNISGLAYGLHYVSYRFQDEAGNWSSAVSKFFSHYPEAETPEMQEITAMEYWYDGDYSTVEKSILHSSETFQLKTMLDVSGLDHGLHYVSYRFQDEAGNWAPAVSKFFMHYPAAETPEMREIVEYEYWFDGDNSTPVSISVANQESLAINETIDIKTLGEGLHFISHRFKDKSGNWSPAVSNFFTYFKDEILPADNKIVGYRYWANDNIASATEVTLATPVKSLVLDELIDVANFPGGIPVASFQFVDTQGNWSSAISKSISKPVQPKVVLSADDSTVCLGTPILFDADITDADVIEWKFGDGSSSSEISPEHIYTEAGVFEVSAIVTHTDSSKSAYDTIIGGIEVYPSQNIWLGDADTIFFSSFESDDLNTAPAGWIQKYDGTGTANQVVVDDPVKNGVKSFQMEGASSWASEYYRRPATMPTEVTLEAWVNCEKILSGLAGSIGVGNFNVGSWGTRTSRLQFTNGKISATYSDGPTYEIMDYTPGQWYHVKMIHDLANRSYQVYINNVQVSGTNGSETTYDFPMHPSVETIDVMLCAGNSGTTKMFFDDILLSEKGDFEVCESDLPYQLGSQQITSEGFYSETMTNSYGCDSVVSFNLVINPSDSIWLADTICEGDLPYTFGEQSLIADGIYTEDFPTAFGCDSVVTLTLVVNDTTINTDAVTICETDLPYTFGASSLTSAGIYTEVFSNVYGCDSTVTLTLTVNDTSLTELEMSVCENDLPLIIGLDTFYNEGVYTKQLNNTMGCDSTVILSLNVLDTSLVTAEIEICENLLPFTFGTQSLSAGGVYSESFEKDNGCDSTVILTLIVKDTFAVLDTVTVCESELPFNWDGDELWTSGPYIRTFTAENGCDSTVSLTFNVLDSSLVERKITVCESELPFTFGTQTLGTSGIFTEVFDAANGCDSTVILTLNVLDSTIRNQVVTVCAGDVPYVFGTQTLSSSGIFTEVFNGSNGCDSTVILNLTVSDTFRIADTVTICENDIPYTFGTQTLLTDGIYTELFTTTAGCDSTVVLVFAINDTAQTAFADTVCENDLPYVFGSQSLTSSGVYSEAFVAANGCDSVVTLSLKVHQSYVTHIYETVSPSELPFVFGSQQLTKTGTFSNTYPTIFGCDSTITLHLQVRDINPPVAKCNPIEVELNHNGFYSLDNFDLEAIAQGSNDDISEFEDLTISVSPAEFTCENIGENAVTVKVKDAVGNQATCTTTITVLDQIANPKIDEVDNQIMDEDSNLELVLTGILGGTACETWDVALSATSLGTDLISELTIDHLPNDSSALLHILLQDNQHGIDSIFISVQDSLGNSTSIGFLLTVNAVNDRPEIVQEIEDQIMTAGDSASITVSKIPGEYYSDLDDTTFIFSLDAENEELPDWIVIRETFEQYIYTFTPSESDTGCFNFILTIEDEAGGATYDTFRVCIDPLEVGVSVLKANDFGINLYPNPTRGEVNITLKSPPQGEIELLVTSISGSEVLRKTYRSGERISFNLSENISGTYLVILQMHNKRVVRKLILDKK